MASETRNAPPIGTASARNDGASRSSASDAAEFSKDTAQEIWNDAKEGVRSAVDERQHAAADQIEEFADTLRGAAGADSSSPSAHMAVGAADALERISRTLRSKEVGTIVHDVESIARRQPALFLGAAVAVGFVAARFLKTGSGHDGASAREASASSGTQARSAASAVH